MELGECVRAEGAPNSEGYGRVAPGRQYAHRAAWEAVHGPIPDGAVIDHRCHNRMCVRPSHLRLSDRSRNNQNRKGPASHGTSGFRGVTRSRTRWRAQAMKAGRYYHGGVFDTPEEAAEAARELRNRLFTDNDKDRT